MQRNVARMSISLKFNRTKVSRVFIPELSLELRFFVRRHLLRKTITRYNADYHLEVLSTAPHALTILRITCGPYHYAL